MNGAPSTSGPLLVLPRGRHAASRAVVRQSQVDRMLGAMADAVAEKGYARVAVADVIARAGVSRKTFYEHFSNKESCFLAAYEAGVEALLGAIDAEIQSHAPDWIAAGRAGTRTYLEALAANPSFARTFLIEVLGAGPEALERRTRVHERFAEQLAAVHAAARADLPELPDPPAHLFRASVGATNELVTDELLRHGAERLPELVDVLQDVHLGLLVGRELATRLLAAQDEPRV